MKTIVGLYDEINDAQGVVNELVQLDFDRNDISLVAADHDRLHAAHLEGEEGSKAGEGAAAGAVAGTAVGGLAGLLVGLGALAIPGVGPIIAAGPIAATLAGAGIGAAAGGLIGALIGWGIPEEEAEYYAEGVRRGGTLVAVKARDAQIETAVDVMNRHDPVDIERRSEFWRSSGWDGFDHDAEPYTVDDYTAEREAYAAYDNDDFYSYAPLFQQHYNTAFAATGNPYSYYEPGYRYGYTLATDERYRDYNDWSRLETPARAEWERNPDTSDSAWDEFKDAVREAWEEVKDAFDGDDDDDLNMRGHSNGGEKFDVVEEELRVGTREVERGGVRVRTYIEEVPVEESAQVREEHVNVERRAVNRPAGAADLDAFEEKSFEVTETAEELVVDKQARVIEEVVISKDVDVHTETVQDTVRRTHVDVDEIGDFDEYDAGFRNHYNTTFATSGYKYDQYRPAYRYGYALAADDRYYGRDWNEIEPEARRRWEETNRGTWEEFKDAVRHGWNEIRVATM